MGSLKLEVGKFYRTRNGQKAECVFCKPEGLGTRTVFQCIVLFEGGQHVSYMENGSHWYDVKISGYDIISEWEETPEDICKRIGFDPSCLPAWASWIAMDKTLKWVYYEIDPEQTKGGFYAKRGCAGCIPNKYGPTNFTGHWIESKFKVK